MCHGDLSWSGERVNVDKDGNVPGLKSSRHGHGRLGPALESSLWLKDFELRRRHAVVVHLEPAKHIGLHFRIALELALLAPVVLVKQFGHPRSVRHESTDAKRSSVLASLSSTRSIPENLSEGGTHNGVYVRTRKARDVDLEGAGGVLSETGLVRGRAARHVDGVALAHHGDDGGGVGVGSVDCLESKSIRTIASGCGKIEARSVPSGRDIKLKKSQIKRIEWLQRRWGRDAGKRARAQLLKVMCQILGVYEFALGNSAMLGGPPSGGFQASGR
ncbi:hypothetical protein B0H13DRAFT_1865254 [Mycena leptocephala]|nr:hypothetical protein B0H13DRAFT_1865254 [Mycena leptocephala]